MVTKAQREAKAAAEAAAEAAREAQEEGEMSTAVEDTDPDSPEYVEEEAEREQEDGEQVSEAAEDEEAVPDIFAIADAPETIRKKRARKEFNADKGLVAALWASYNNDLWYTVSDTQYGSDAKKTVLFIRKHADHLGLGLTSPESSWVDGNIKFKAQKRKIYNA